MKYLWSKVFCVGGAEGERQTIKKEDKVWSITELEEEYDMSCAEGRDSPYLKRGVPGPGQEVGFLSSMVNWILCSI